MKEKSETVAHGNVSEVICFYQGFWIHHSNQTVAIYGAILKDINISVKKKHHSSHHKHV